MKYRKFLCCLFSLMFAMFVGFSTINGGDVFAKNKSGKRASSNSKKKSGKRASSSSKKTSKKRAANSKKSSKSGKRAAATSRSRSSGSSSSSSRSGKRAAATSRNSRSSSGSSTSSSSNRSGKRAAATSRRSGTSSGSSRSVTTKSSSTTASSSSNSKSNKRAAARRVVKRIKRANICPLNTALTVIDETYFKNPQNDTTCQKSENTSVSETTEGVVLKCNPGYYDSEDGTSCVACPKGSFCTNGKKELCSYGYYTDNTAMSVCTKCDGDGVTNEKGATSKSMCLNIECPSGYVLSLANAETENTDSTNTVEPTTKTTTTETTATTTENTTTK